MFMKYGEITSVSEHTNRESREIELHGVLQKKNRKGFFQNRYFRTSGVLLSYYKDKESFERDPLFPKASFKFTDMTSVVIVGSEGRFLLSFAIASLELELRAVNESHAIHWTSFIRAKINLYSVNMLLTMDNSSTVSNNENLLFVTTIFRQLMLLKPSDQDSWNQTALNDHFEAIFTNRSGAKMSNDELCILLMGAGHKALDDFTFSCEQCEIEFRTRNPRVIAHCREYMRRYTKLFSGRLILELSSVLGPTEDTNQLAPLSVLAVIYFLQRIQQLNRFSFLPAAELSQIFLNLKSLDYMCETFVYICHAGLRYWLSKVAQLQPRQQGKILSDIPLEIEEKIEAIQPFKDKFDEMIYFSLSKDTMSGMLSELNYFLISFCFDDFSEEALTDHIVACYKIDQYAAETCRSWVPHQVSSTELSPSTYSLYLSNGEIGGENSKHPAKLLLDISDSCRRNSMRAAAMCARKILPALQDLLSIFFRDGSDLSSGWIGGRACKAMLLRLSSWIEGMRSSVPSEYLVLVKAEAYRFAVVLYYSTFVMFYKANKKAQLSSEGVEQVIMDLRLIEMWIAETGVCAECEPLKEIIKKMRLYLTCEATDLLVCFSGSVQDFASDCPMYAYDLFRVAMKLRNDVSADYRRRVLGMCTEYMTQFKFVYEKTYGVSIDSKDEKLLSGSDYFSKRMSGESILSEIMPLAGVEHCTGKKWSLEKVPYLSADESIFITNLVTEACHHIRMMRLAQRSSITISAGRSSKRRPSTLKSAKSVHKRPVEAVAQPSRPESNSNPFDDNSNPFDDDSNPFASDNENEEVIRDEKGKVNMNNTNERETSTESTNNNEDTHHTEPEKSVDGNAPRLLYMDCVTYEGSNNIVKESVNSKYPLFYSNDHTFGKTQVIHLQGGNFGELHESLKPFNLVLTPFTGTLPSRNDIVGTQSTLDHNAETTNFVVTDAENCVCLPQNSFEFEPSFDESAVAVADENDVSDAEIQASCDTANDSARAMLIASYSAEYLLVSSENKSVGELDSEMVLQPTESIMDTKNKISIASQQTSEGSNQAGEVNYRPVSMCRLDSSALFIVPPQESSAEVDSVINFQVASSSKGKCSPETHIDSVSVKTPYVVIYGPGSVLRKDISLESPKVKALPCGSIVGVYEQSAAVNSEGIFRVRATYRGVEGWTSFKARDGTIIIEPCLPGGSTPGAMPVAAVMPPPKPPKRKSLSTSTLGGENIFQAEAQDSNPVDSMIQISSQVDNQDIGCGGAICSIEVTSGVSAVPIYRKHANSEGDSATLTATPRVKPPKPPRKNSMSNPSLIEMDKPSAPDLACSSPEIENVDNITSSSPGTGTGSDYQSDLVVSSSLSNDIGCCECSVIGTDIGQANSNEESLGESESIEPKSSVSESNPPGQGCETELPNRSIPPPKPPRKPLKTPSTRSIDVNLVVEATDWGDAAVTSGGNVCSDEVNAADGQVEEANRKSCSEKRSVDEEICESKSPCQRNSATDETALICDIYEHENSPVEHETAVDSVADSLLEILDSGASAEPLDANNDELVIMDERAVTIAHSILQEGIAHTNVSSESTNKEAEAEPTDPKGKEKPVKPPKKSASLSVATTAAGASTSGSDSPPKACGRPEKPRKVSSSMPVAMLYSPSDPDQSDANAVAVAVAVAVSMPQEMEVLDPSEIRRGGDCTSRRSCGPILLSRASSVDKGEEQVDRLHYNPFDDDDDNEDTGGATAAPNVRNQGSSSRENAMSSSSETDRLDSKKPKRRKSKLSARVISLLHLGRRSSVESNARSDTAASPGRQLPEEQGGHYNPFGTEEDSQHNPFDDCDDDDNEATAASAASGASMAPTAPPQLSSNESAELSARLRVLAQSRQQNDNSS